MIIGIKGTRYACPKVNRDNQSQQSAEHNGRAGIAQSGGIGCLIPKRGAQGPAKHDHPVKHFRLQRADSDYQDGAKVRCQTKSEPHSRASGKAELPACPIPLIRAL
jgi:hypothetical protein